MMDRDYIDANHLVARYLADKLPAAEREAFEAYFLEHPEIVTELEAAARLKVGLAELRSSGELKNLTRSRAYWFPRITGIAASVLMVAILAIWFAHAPKAPLLASSLKSFTNASGKLPTIAATRTLIRLRGAESDAVIPLTQPGQAVELRVLPEIQTAPQRYRVAILAISRTGESKVLGTVGELTPDGEGLISVFIEPHRLGAGHYRLSVSGDAGTDIANASSTFGIEVR